VRNQVAQQSGTIREELPPAEITLGFESHETAALERRICDRALGFH
jgi:hypothetical protein